MGFFNKLTSLIKNVFIGGRNYEDTIEDFTEQEDEIFDVEDYIEQEDYTAQEEIYLQKIKEIIDYIKRTHPDAGDWFGSMLDDEIDIYGAKSVAEGLDSVQPKELEGMVAVTYYRPESSLGQEALTKLMMTITSEVPTSEDLKNMEDKLYNDSYWD